MLVLRALDGVLFIMPDRVAERCGVLRPALEDTEGSEGCVPVPGISAATLAMIVEFYTRVDESGVLDIPLAAVKARFFDDIPVRPDLFSLMNAANFLDARELLDDACVFMADQLRGKSPEHIRDLLGITTDMTSGDSATIAEQLDWALP